MALEMLLFVIALTMALTAFAVAVRGCKKSFERGRKVGYDEGLAAGREETQAIEKRLKNWYD